MNAYSEDLRKKIVEALGRGMGKSEAARTFSVSLSSVKRYATWQGGPVARAQEKTRLQAEAQRGTRRLLEADLKERPFVTLQQRREYLRVVACVEVSRSTLCRAIKRMRSTRKKGADQLQTRRVFEGCLEGDGCRGLDPRWLVFVDECGTHTSLAPLYGYSPKVSGFAFCAP